MPITLDSTSFNFLPTLGPFDLIFHRTWIALSVLGEPNGGYTLTLGGLLIVAFLAFVVNVFIERLTHRNTGGLVRAVAFTLIGAFLVSAYVALPFEVEVEGVRIITTLVGALVVGIFYNLLKGQSQQVKA
jgi:uncharacterized membrane protein YeaQ/YmgE (transglycosylase-associated protein family)